MSSFTLAAIYSLLIFVAALAGGWVPLLVRLTHTRMQVALSFVAGVILGIGLLHLLPHGYEELQNIDQAVGWMMVGFLTMFFLERFFHFHQHGAPADAAGISHHGDETAHHHDHAHGECSHEHTDLPAANALSWGGVLVGLAFHALMDGIAVGAAISVESAESHGGLAGLGTFLAVVLHKPFDSLTIGTLLAAGGRPPRVRHIVNVLYALVAPLGIFGFSVGLAGLVHSHPGLMGGVLCFAGGAFLCIATSDLLPEVQFHSHDRVKLSVALLLGVALAAAIVLVETSGHAGQHQAANVNIDATGS